MTTFAKGKYEAAAHKDKRKKKKRRENKRRKNKRKSVGRMQRTIEKLQARQRKLEY